MTRRGENIYKRKDGRYEGRYIKARDANGKDVYGYVYDRSYSGVKEKLRSCRYEKKRAPIGSDLFISEWIASWLDSKRDIKDSTRELYLRHIRNHILPALGYLKLKDLTPKSVKLFIDSITAKASTVKLIFSILKGALKDAAEKGYIEDVCASVKLPRSKRANTEILTLEQQIKLESVLSDRNDIGVLICLYSGLRIGELCALKWRDTDLEHGLIHINGTQSRINGKLTITSPKSRSSVRSIPIPDCLIRELLKLDRDGEFVLSNNGKMVDVRTYRRRFKKLLKEAGLPDISALRHTFGTRALEVGMDCKTLSEILGHASVAITMDLYVHSLYEHKKKQMNKLNILHDIQS